MREAYSAELRRYTDGHGGTLVTQAQPQQQPRLTHPQVADWLGSCERVSRSPAGQPGAAPLPANVLRCARAAGPLSSFWDWLRGANQLAPVAHGLPRQLRQLGDVGGDA
jgi:hypothetical protein